VDAHADSNPAPGRGTDPGADRDSGAYAELGANTERPRTYGYARAADFDANDHPDADDHADADSDADADENAGAPEKDTDSASSPAVERVAPGLTARRFTSDDPCMALYEYLCAACGTRTDKRMPMSDVLQQIPCPKCGKQARKTMGSWSVVGGTQAGVEDGPAPWDSDGGGDDFGGEGLGGGFDMGGHGHSHGAGGHSH